VKQMKVIYMNGFTEEECLQFRDLVHSNVFQAIRELVQGVVSENLPLSDANSVSFVYIFFFTMSHFLFLANHSQTLAF